MANAVLNWACDQDCQSTAAKLILIIMANLARTSGVCWPSISYLVNRTNLSRPGVIKAIRRLETMGLIEVYRAHIPESKARRVNRYRLLFENNLKKKGGVVNPVNQGVVNYKNGIPYYKIRTRKKPRAATPVEKALEECTNIGFGRTPSLSIVKK